MWNDLLSLCKRRGFVFQSSEIYGGLNSCWDYGPLGVELKMRLKENWWRTNVRGRPDVVGMDSSILMHPQVWEASGHVDSFTDALVDCRECKNRFRADHLEGDRCPECGGELTEPRNFNLMFRTSLGSTLETASEIFLRPETCQALFVNFQNVIKSARLRVPFGIAQIGKSFRNEVTTKSFIFRSREFEQMELEYFVHPDDAGKYFDYWVNARMDWYKSLGVRPECLRFQVHAADKLAHYAKACTDIEYKFPFGWDELEGIADRGDFDLGRHQEFSGKPLIYIDNITNERFVPHVIETSGGIDRTILTLLSDAYDVEKVTGVKGEEERIVLRFHPKIAPVTVAVLPLSRKPALKEICLKVREDLEGEFAAQYDETGSIGKRYRRQDEVGTPFAVTVDFDTLEDHAATIRYRDSMLQIRVPLDRIKEVLWEEYAKPWTRP